MPRVVKWTLRGMVAIAALIALIFITAWIVFDTEAGTRWAIGKADEVLPGQLDASEFDGTLWQGLQFPLLRYSDASVEIEVRNLAFDIHWFRLAASTLAIDEIAADTIRYRSLTPPPPAPVALEISMPAVPLAIAIDGIDVGKIELLDAGSTTEIQLVAGRNIAIEGQTITARSISAIYDDIAVSIKPVALTVAGKIPVRAALSWKTQDDAWSGQGTVSGSLAELTFEHSVEGTYPATASGKAILLNRVAPEVDANVEWEHWSFDGTVLRDGSLSVNGVLDDYTANFDTEVVLSDEKQFRVVGTGQGDSEQLHSFAARVSSVYANADLDGSVSWAPTFTAQAQISASGFDPGFIAAALQGSLNVDALVSIRGSDSISVAGLSVSGTLNGQPARATGDFQWTPDRLQCDACDIRIGQNRLQVEGNSSGDAIALSLLLDAPVLAELWPGLSGAATLDGDLTGTLDNPGFSGDLAAQQLRLGDLAASDVHIRSRKSDLQIVNIAATLQDIRRGETELGSLQVSGTGRMDDLLVNIGWTFQDIVVTADAVARIDGSSIDGTIDGGTITEATSGEWKLTQSFAFTVYENNVEIQPHTWEGDNGKVSVSTFAITDSQSAIAATIENLPLQIANSWLPQNVRLLGSAMANVDVVQQAGVWSGTLSWQQSDTLLEITEADNQVTRVVVPRAEMNAQLGDGGISAKARLSIDPGITAELDAGITQIAADAPVQARLTLQGEQWDWVSAVIPQIDAFKGTISADIKADGPLNAPGFAGNVDWHDGQLVVPALNVPMKNIELVISGASAGTATLTGSAKAGDGTLSVNGLFEELMLPTRSLNLVLKGDSAELINWPEYQLWASPDLVVTADSDGWRFNGQIDVPRANITLPELPVEAVRTSSDVTILGEEETVTTTTRISGETRLVLGDKVHISALGLDTDLQGYLLLQVPAGKERVASGRVTLVNGVFAAYGQKLTISEGNLTFTGPLDDPLVDVKAVRVIETFDGTVTAGIHLRGRAQNLSSTVFSEPTMADADALSYLVIGRPLNQATESDGNELSGAAVALGLRQATRLTDQIGQTIGLDQLSLTGDGGDTTALVAGKQINSRLYARYAYGVFSRLGTLLLRYKLSRRLTLEAGAGENQSIDLLYSVEKP